MPCGASLGGENPLLDAAYRLPVVQHVGEDIHQQGGSLDGAVVPAVAAHVAEPVHALVVAGVGTLLDAVGKADSLGGVAHVQHQQGELTLSVERFGFKATHTAQLVVEVVGLLRDAVAFAEGLCIGVKTAGVEQ